MAAELIKPDDGCSETLQLQVLWFVSVILINADGGWILNFSSLSSSLSNSVKSLVFEQCFTKKNLSFVFYV